MSNKRKIISAILFYTISISALFVIIFPIIYALLSSFKTNKDILSGTFHLIPKEFHFENYVKAWVIADFKTYTWNSVYMTFFEVVGSVILSSMAGYAFSRSDFPGKKIIFAILTATMFISIGSAGLWKLLDIARVLHINNSLWGVIIIRLFSAHVAFIFMIRNYLHGIPTEIDEAASIDGASFGRIWATIILPLLKPILATIAIMEFRAAWNDYLMPMVFTISNPRHAPLTVGLMILKNSGDAAASWDILLAGVIISAIPMIVIYSFLGKWFVRGVTAGAVKG